MGINFAQSWPVYLMLVAFVVFVIYVIINGRQQEKKDKEAHGIKEDISPKR
ncbi:MAG: hypothetical protein PHN59_03730 [Candidatus Omnitrophica bacterium]|nr:hypothetical protein [Candidatus Omnitrophota bacterium]